ncbi:Regulator of chromosome condensation repeat containing protein [Oryctes borbonicus]|uniref:Regulator of chromosome condensation repeat containing protein n=1 Tax=Oryctes borbonicus TaxID=1629725 RepID=A0A0T6B2J5_9SCAR|nr:Regulator of chromosome condensation repeat containing protein [Oryctes borbonicus]
MKVWYTGFNLYNQFHSSKKYIIDDFEAAEHADLKDIVLSHTYIIVWDSNIAFYGEVNPNLSFEEVKDVRQISAADNITYILYNNGNIKKLDTVTGYITNTSNFLNVENPGNDGDCIDKIACGTKINIATTRGHRVYNIPNRLQYKGRRIKQIVTGHEHCLILDSNGDVYSFGCGLRGQLGHGTLENETNPTLIEALAGVKIQKIAAGGWHSCAISVTGDLYTWGWNSNGQLAIPTERNISVFASPKPVCFADADCNVDDVVCGSKHTVIRLGSQLYGAGWNKYKQLANIDDNNVYEFKLMKDFGLEEILSLNCGPWSTAIVTK